MTDYPICRYCHRGRTVSRPETLDVYTQGGSPFLISLPAGAVVCGQKPNQIGVKDGVIYRCSDFQLDERKVPKLWVREEGKDEEV